MGALKKYILALFFSIVLLFPVVSYGAETCSEGVDCEESINENTWDIKSRFDDLSTYLGVDSSPITLIDSSDFNSNVGELSELLFLFMGLSLFASAFSIGLWIYKR